MTVVVVLDIVALWFLACLFFREQISKRIGHVIWLIFLIGVIFISDYNNSIFTVKEHLSILPFQYSGTLTVFCILVLLANSYLFKRSHLTILLMTFLSLVVWMIIRIQAVLLNELIGTPELWNHIFGCAFAIVLYFAFTKFIGHVYFEKMTAIQQFVLYIIFFASIVAYEFYIEGIPEVLQRILLIVAALLCVFFTLFIYTQKRQQAMVARLQAAEEYVPIIDELVMEVRARQHEFANKMLAVTSILEMADTLEDARLRISEFTHDVRLQPHQEQLLTMDHKIVAGFLYAKLRRAEQMGVHVEIDFAVSAHKMPCEEVDLVEVLGILLDNAFEASQSGETVKLICRLVGGQVRLEVSNAAPALTNEQMMQMFEIGYSTKGEKRGFGLHNLKQISKQYNAQVILKNKSNRLTIGLQFTA